MPSNNYILLYESRENQTLCKYRVENVYEKLLLDF
jgi:hypothetical protein